MSSFQRGNSDSVDNERRRRKIKFGPLPTSIKFDIPESNDLWQKIKKQNINTSIWVWIAIGLLFVSNVLYFVAFLTNGWGVLLVDATKPTAGQSVQSLTASQQNATKGHTNLFADERYWNFGLWECCRNDGFCLGTRWPPFYIATRSFCVLGLFGQIFLLTWLIGYVLENLLNYDICTLTAFLALNITTAIFMLIPICAFGTMWPKEFQNDFHGRDTYLSYSFVLAISSMIFVMGSIGFLMVECCQTRIALKRFKAKRKENQRKDWATAEDLLGHSDEYSSDENDEMNEGIELENFSEKQYAHMRPSTSKHRSAWDSTYSGEHDDSIHIT